MRFSQLGRLRLDDSPLGEQVAPAPLEQIRGADADEDGGPYDEDVERVSAVRPGQDDDDVADEIRPGGHDAKTNRRRITTNANMAIRRRAGAA